MDEINEARIRQLIAAELECLFGERAPEAMNAQQVAEFLGVDRKTVYDYANRGQIPHRRLGKRHLFSRSAIVAWLRGCKAAGFQEGT